jgi:hypothetical protein
VAWRPVRAGARRQLPPLPPVVTPLHRSLFLYLLILQLIIILTTSVSSLTAYIVLQDIQTSNLASSPHPAILLNICRLLSDHNHRSISLIWLPGDKTHPYLMTVDSLAKQASKSDSILQIHLATQEVVLGVKEWIQERWEHRWKVNSTCLYQRTTQINKTCFEFTNNRRKESIINRLRLHQTYLNGGLAKIGLIEDGSCPSCGVIQDGAHFLLNCP